MELTGEHIAFIKQDIQKKGISMDNLADSLVDHICCTIENIPETDFQSVYNKALSSFGANGLEIIQKETILLLTLKRRIIMKKTMFLFAYIAAFLITTGLLFKLQHWPMASILLTLGIVILNLGFLPVYFYDRYKRSISE